MFDNYFSESNADNHIYLEFTVQNFVKALSSTKTTKTVYMKLSRYRGTPSLVFDMEVLPLFPFDIDSGRDKHPSRHIGEGLAASGI